MSLVRPNSASLNSLGPGRCVVASARNVSRCSDTLSAVNTCVAVAETIQLSGARSAYPCPLLGGGIEFPEIVENSGMPGVIDAVASEEPEIPFASTHVLPP